MSEATGERVMRKGWSFPLDMDGEPQSRSDRTVGAFELGARHQSDGTWSWDVVPGPGVEPVGGWDSPTLGMGNETSEPAAQLAAENALREILDAARKELGE